MENLRSARNRPVIWLVCVEEAATLADSKIRSYLERI